MQVRLKARDDAKSLLFSECKVLIDIAAGIDDDRLASAHVDEVRVVGERLVGDRMDVIGGHVVILSVKGPARAPSSGYLGHTTTPPEAQIPIMEPAAAVRTT